ncbi:AAA family ATPase [Chitinimonas sp. JJ19]|uniref:AAA family ATPase n=1 Tax=Chitinimonas sp. JJ19 TaxID=3109352 RepID=UPI003001FFCA
MNAIMEESKRLALRATQPVQTQLPEVDGPARLRGQADSSQLPDRIADLVYSIPARRRLSELVLKVEVVEQVEELLHEFSNAGLLRSHSLEPRHTVLLVGPPGNGKTSLAEVFACELGLPLLSLRYDAIVDSFLGETSNRLRKLIEYATLNPCVLFFDEFDAVGKERSDAQETGEIKRVVSSLLMQMDRLPSHTLIVCATNHPELLDRAVWRRFELKLEIDQPDHKQLTTWFRRFEKSLSGPAGISPEQFASYMSGENMSAVEAFTLDVRRKIVLSHDKLSPAEAIRLVMKRGKLPAIDTSGEEKNGEGISTSTPEKNKHRRKVQGT